HLDSRPVDHRSTRGSGSEPRFDLTDLLSASLRLSGEKSASLRLSGEKTILDSACRLYGGLDGELDFTTSKLDQGVRRRIVAASNSAATLLFAADRQLEGSRDKRSLRRGPS